MSDSIYSQMIINITAKPDEDFEKQIQNVQKKISDVTDSFNRLSKISNQTAANITSASNKAAQGWNNAAKALENYNAKMTQPNARQEKGTSNTTDPKKDPTANTTQPRNVNVGPVNITIHGTKTTNPSSNVTASLDSKGLGINVPKNIIEGTTPEIKPHGR